MVEFFVAEKLPGGSTLYLLNRPDQDLPVATEEPILFTPHYNTLIKSGMHEYYTSEGKSSLCTCLHNPVL